MLCLVGLGLNEKSYSREGYNAVQKADKVYLEGYTVNFPYDVDELNGVFGKEIEVLGREEVESEQLINEAKKKKIVLLIYGSPLFATTHMTLLEDAKKAKVKTEVIYASSIFDALGGVGLQLYKFGKITSMPQWTNDYKPDSFMNIVEENKSIKAHTLILIDIGLKFGDALDQLTQAANHKKMTLGKVIVCTQMGTSKAKVMYDTVSKLKENKKVQMPFCLIMPSEMHFSEEEALK